VGGFALNTVNESHFIFLTKKEEEETKEKISRTPRYSFEKFEEDKIKYELIDGY
jgi:hypothetical protein